MRLRGVRPNFEMTAHLEPIRPGPGSRTLSGPSLASPYVSRVGWGPNPFRSSDSDTASSDEYHGRMAFCGSRADRV
jgi:hypothetical protein